MGYHLSKDSRQFWVVIITYPMTYGLACQTSFRAGRYRLEIMNALREARETSRETIPMMELYVAIRRNEPLLFRSCKLSWCHSLSFDLSRKLILFHEILVPRKFWSIAMRLYIAIAEKYPILI